MNTGSPSRGFPASWSSGHPQTRRRALQHGAAWTRTHWRLGSTLRPKGTHLGLEKTQSGRPCGRGWGTRAGLTGVRSPPESRGHSHAGHPRGLPGGGGEAWGFRAARLRVTVCRGPWPGPARVRTRTPAQNPGSCNTPARRSSSPAHGPRPTAHAELLRTALWPGHVAGPQVRQPCPLTAANPSPPARLAEQTSAWTETDSKEEASTDLGWSPACCCSSARG